MGTVAKNILDSPIEVKTTRKTGGLHEPYKGLRQAAPKGAVKRSADRI